MTFTTSNHSSRFLFIHVFAPYVCLLLLSCHFSTSRTPSVVVVGATSTQQQQQQQHSIRNVTQCREQGFDPQHLACSTCDLLPTQQQQQQLFQTNCRNCCQTYKDVASLLHPYQSAVLIHYESRGVKSPVDELLEDENNNAEWDKFVTEELGGRLQVLKRDPMENFKSNELDILAMLSLQRSTAGEVLFLDERIPANSKSITYEKAVKLAKERVSLRDLSQDDIRDMLKTLLPPLTAAAQQEKESKSSSSSWSFF